MDIQKEITAIVKKITSDKELLEKFKKNPTSVVKELIGVTITQEQINTVVTAVKAKLTAENVSTIANGLGTLLKKNSK